MKMLSKR